MNQKGFTLIELLVVVLIIGILSSIALPQYTTAVEKARASEAWSTMKAINDAQAIRNMEMGTTDTIYNLDELSIEVPQTSKNFCYAFNPSSGSSVNFGNCSCGAYGNGANKKPLLPRGVAKEIPPYMSFRLTVEEEPVGGMVKQKQEFLFVNPL